MRPSHLLPIAVPPRPLIYVVLLDLRHETSPDPGGQVANVREQARALFQSIFTGGYRRSQPQAAQQVVDCPSSRNATFSTRKCINDCSDSSSPPRLLRTHHARAHTQPARLHDANLVIVDDNLLPSHATLPTGASWRDAAQPQPPSQVEAFPGLPPATAPRAPVPTWRPPPRAPPAQPPAPAAAPLDSAMNNRLAMLRDAFGKKEGDASSFASDATRSFSASALELARSKPGWVSSLEGQLDDFLRSGKRRESLPPMTRLERQVCDGCHSHTCW